MGYTSIEAVSKQLERNILRGQARAMNKALAITKTKITKDLRDATSLKLKTINGRVLLRKANIKNLVASFNLATKIGIPIHDFSPRKAKVDISKKRYYGVSAKILGGREFIPGGFLRAVKSGKEVVLARKATIRGGTYHNIKGSKYPTALLRTTALRDAMLKNADSSKRFLLAQFNRIVAAEVDFSIVQYIGK